jgi:methyl-accepting chemotaxis protein
MFKTRGIRTKLLYFSGFLSTLSVMLGLVGFWSLKTVTAEYSHIANRTTPKIELSNQMSTNYRNVRIAMRTLGLPGISESDAKKAIQETQKAIEDYEAANKEYTSIPITPGQKELYDKVNAAWLDFKQTGARVISLYQTGKPEDRQKIIQIFFTECPEKSAVFNAAVNDLVSFHHSQGRKRIASANNTADRGYMTLLTLIIAGIAMSVSIAILFARSISRVLQATVSALSTGASQVKMEISQLSHASGELSTSATQQATAIQQTSASVEEIRAMVDKNSQNAIDSAKSSELSKVQAEKGQKVVEEMMHSMTQIEQSNESIMNEITESNRRIGEIVQVIQEVGSKTQVINDIVFQTKLLSFNASVEAARAGEHGKGFAVVAEEVGKLAQMSGNAAKEISDMLQGSVAKVEGIVHETKQRVETLMNGSRQIVGRGSEVAKQCGDVLGEIVKNARHVSEMVREISSASEEQSKGVAEIAKAIQELDESTQTNALAAHRTATSANTLHSQLNTLHRATEQLRAVVLGNDSRYVVSRFVWSDQYATGVGAMDDEHKVLISKINHLASVLEQNAQSPSRLIGPFQDLATYTQKHFFDEEGYMESIGYPELEAHRTIHNKLLAQVGEFGEQLKKGHVQGDELISFLNDWLLRHILGTDMKYAKHSKHTSDRHVKAA